MRLDDVYALLSEQDTVLASLVTEHGTPDPFEWSEGATAAVTDPLAALLLHVCGQQISVRAAITVHRRLCALAGGDLTPGALLALRAEELTGIGLSRAKAASVLDLARRLGAGQLSLSALEAHTDEEAIAALTAVRGIGPWTAHMYVLHQLRRPDVLPVGDIGLRRAAEAFYGLMPPCSADDLAALGERWRPYRSYAAALLWRALHLRRLAGGRGVPTGATDSPTGDLRDAGVPRHPVLG